MKAIVIGMAAVVLSGCGAGQQQQLMSLAVTSSDFCKVHSDKAGRPVKPTWSINDTPESIHQARQLGAQIDQLCGLPKVANK